MAALRIEDYALIGNTHTAALVGRDGSIDWLCLPSFDAGACFAALLGTNENGRWLIAPEGTPTANYRHYREGTLVLETYFETATGTVSIIDFMPKPESVEHTDLVRLVRGHSGEVDMIFDLVLRFDYGRIVPWVRHRDYGLHAVAGPDAVALHTTVELEGENFHTKARFTVHEGETVAFSLNWHPSHTPEPEAGDPLKLLEATTEEWKRWSDRCTVEGPWREPVTRSLITLKALTYAPTGGIVAAPTTSLPEHIGGVRNWDYRFCWLRDATFTLYALLTSGYTDEAVAWRDWLLRSAAGSPEELQIMYGIRGERRLPELELPWLNGYENSRPVRIGNGAHAQFQLDVYGEVMDALHVARRHHVKFDGDAWRVQSLLTCFVEDVWDQPDEGIWEVRGPPQHFTHSKVMAWVALDRAVKGFERHGLPGPVERWREVRARIHADICAKGFDSERGSFVGAYGSKSLDAALLMIPMVGFLPASDPRVIATVDAIRRELVVDGLVLRYDTSAVADGLPPGEGAFLPCSFWLADNLAMTGRFTEARDMFERLLDLRNDVGLLAEEYDPIAGRQLGNFPQAFTHVALINTAQNLVLARGPAYRRPQA